ncbi:MAG: anti-sigma factor antagonist, partial [Candidatus Latescibacterota bacterium]
KRVSIEERKELLEIIKQNPELGAKRIAEEYNKGRDSSKHLTQRMVYDELKRLGLNTKELRVEYLKRHKLYEEDEEAARRTSREMVEELIKEVSAEPTVPKEKAPDFDISELEPAIETGRREEVPDFAESSDFDIDEAVYGPVEMDETVGDIELSVLSEQDDITVLKVDGHLDSVSTGALEQKLNEIIAGGAYRVVVDLANVSYISSGGWGILVSEVKRLREKGGDVVLVGMSPEVYDVYELLGFCDILKALPDVGAARTYFQKPLEERVAEKSEAAYVPDLDVPEPGAPTDGLAGEVAPAEWDSLRIEAATVGEKGDIAVLSLTGIIDTVSAENLRTAIDKVIINGISKIVIDMSLVEYVSSGGWGTFTERLRELRRRGGDIKLFGMDPDVYYIFTMLGFNIVLSSFDILTDAIEDFKRAVDGKPSIHPQQPASEPAAEPERPAPVPETPPASVEEIAEIDIDEPEVTRPVVSGDEWARWEESDGVLIGTITGPIEAVAVGRLDQELDAKVESKPVFVLLDLGGVDYISSTGWGLIAKYYDRVSAWGGAIALCRMSQDLHEIFGFLEFRSIIKTYPTRDEAIRAFRERPGLIDQAPAEMIDTSSEEPVEAGLDTVLSDDSREAPDVEVDEEVDYEGSVEEILGETAGDEVAESRTDDVGLVGDEVAESRTDDAGFVGDEVAESDTHDVDLLGEEPIEETIDGALGGAPVGEDILEEVGADAEAYREEAPAAEQWETSPQFGSEPEETAVFGQEETRAPAESPKSKEASIDEWGEDEPRDDIFVDFADEPHRVDIDSAVTDDRISEDKKLRDLGWEQYGQRLRKIIKQEKPAGKNPDDDNRD